MKNIGFIGIGNMGQSMVKAILKQTDKNLYLYDIHQSCYEAFAGEQTVEGCTTIGDVVSKSDLVFITVKPHLYDTVLKEVSETLEKQQVIVTVAPGYTIERVKKALANGHEKIVRTMPNTPALVGMGVTAYACEGDSVTEEELREVKACLETFGNAYALSETLIDATVPVSGSSPAYAYMFIEAMADAGVKFGLPRALAYEMSAQSLKGAAEMVLQTKQHPGALKDAVTSPGGTTIEAVAKLEEMGFRTSVIEAMTACFDKTKAMGK